MSVVSLPPSFNFAENKPASSKSGSAVYSKIRSDNSTYNDGDVIRISIPTGNNMFLSGQDSFFSGKIKPTFTSTAGAVRLDSSIYSIIKRVTIYHGSSMIENITNANRLYNALFDMQCSPADRGAASINLLVDEIGGIGTNNYSYGRAVATTVTYDFAFCLPSLLGSLCDKAIPLAWLNSAEIYVEIELESATKVLTTRTPDSISGSTGVCTALSNVTYQISEFYYNACITSLSGEVSNMLKQAMLSQPLIIPAVSYRGEQRTLNANSTSFSDKFAFQFSSMKGIIWWLTNGQTSNGAIAATNLNAAVTTRTSGPLDQWYISCNGEDFPPSHIKSGIETTDRIFGAEVLSHLERYMNTVAVPGMRSTFTKELYCNSLCTYASDTADAKKFVGGLSLDRYDNDNQRQMQGIDTQSAQFQLCLQFTGTGPGESCYLYAFAMFDMGLELLDGLLVTRY